MGDVQRWTSVIAAATGVAALCVSIVALWFAWAGSRHAALVLTWRDARVSLENRGPANARDVRLTIGTPEQRETSTSGRPGQGLRVDQSVSLLPVGYTLEDRLSLYLGMQPGDYIAEITWHDARLRQQRLTMPMAMQLTNESRPLLSDREASRLSRALGEGVGNSVAERLRRL